MSVPRVADPPQAVTLLAVDPLGLGGALLRGPPGPERDEWMEALKAMLSGPVSPLEAGGDAVPTTPWRRMPPRVAGSRLLGGLDLAATLAVGRPVGERGLLAQADGGILVVPLAERLEQDVAGHLAAALDTGEVVVERDGIAARAPARFACILLDEGEGDERAPAVLAERVAFRLDLGGREGVRVSQSDLSYPQGAPDRAEGVSAILAARARLPDVVVGEDVIEALCVAGQAFGVPSLRVATFALRAAKAAAALAGRDAVEADDVALAAMLIIAPRATTMPAPLDEAREDDPPGEDAADDDDAGDDLPPEQADQTAPPDPAPDRDTDDERGDPRNLADRVVEATRAAIPAGLLALLALAAGTTARAGASGRAGVPRQAGLRGRPAGTRRGLPGPGARLAIVETLRAAAPWQPLRRAAEAGRGEEPRRILVRKDDFRVARHRQRGESVTIFVVDASGSAALHRLAEVKGAVELILAECYVRRDSVALIAFRGAGAELILPPTRSLARAKRALAGQAGGGGTPLAAAIEAATLVADGARRKGQTALCVFLTDGKANIGFGQRRGRPEAEADAHEAARVFRTGGCPSLVLDIAPRPGAASVRIAAALGARYQPLPHAQAQDLSRVVLDATAADPRRNI